MYIAFIIGFILVFFAFSCNYRSIKIWHIDNICNILIVLFTLYVLINTILNKADIKQAALMSFGMLVYLFIPLIYNNIDLAKIYKACNMYIYISFFIFSFDAMYRLLNPSILSWTYNNKDFFYMFKTNSIMFGDTNEVGFSIVTVCSLILYLKNEKLQAVPLFFSICFLLLVILSFSRAALIGLILTYAYYKYYNKSSSVGKMIFFLIFIIAIMVFYTTYISNDESYHQKEQILQNSLDYFRECSIWQLLLGNGLGNSPIVLGRYAHTFIVVLFVELGILGVLGYSLILFAMIVNEKKTLYVIFPFLIIGISYVPMIVPYVYMAIGVVTLIERKHGHKTINRKMVQIGSKVQIASTI